MNKQNSFGENEPSTQIHESLKSYSSRYKNIKIRKDQKSVAGRNKNEMLPFKLERAAIFIQRYWRFRLLMRRRVYQDLLEQILKQNQLLQHQNACLDKLLYIYNCQQNQSKEFFQSQAKIQAAPVEKHIKQIIRQCIGITFKMQKQTIQSSKIQYLMDQQMSVKQSNAYLEQQKQYLKDKLAGELHEEEEYYLCQIKEENSILLKLSKEKQEIQRKLKEYLIETSKFNLGGL